MKEASLIAHEDAKINVAPAHKKIILECLILNKSFGVDQLSTWDISDETGLTIVEVGRRVGELEKEGKIIYCGTSSNGQGTYSTYRLHNGTPVIRLTKLQALRQAVAELSPEKEKEILQRARELEGK